MTTNTLSSSTELIKNYKQTQILTPDTVFHALQKSNGDSLLFSIGNDGCFYATEEKQGHTTGWERTDMSTATLSNDFKGTALPQCSHLSAAQNKKNSSIGLAMVASDTDNDHLYLSLGNSHEDTSWTSNPNWKSFPFDDSNLQGAQVQIVSISISEASDGEYIVADIRRPDHPQLISRYYIDINNTDGNVWKPHTMIDLNVGTYTSSLGRKKGQNIDGIYTCGSIDGNPELLYIPLYNEFDPKIAPLMTLLNLPTNNNSAQPNPIILTSCRNTDNTSDLYVICDDNGLYYFAANNQDASGTGVLLFNDPMLSKMQSLFAQESNGNVTLWGLNGDGQFFYTTCAQSAITSGASAWSTLMPILTNVKQFSPYINCVNQSNTFLAHTADGNLNKLAKSPATKLWSTHSITIPAKLTQTSQQFSSYTTTLQIEDANNQPAANTPVQISAVTRVPVYINNLYYTLDTTPITINTDMLGTITIIEWISGLQGTRLTVTDGTTTLSINPMDKPFQKLMQLNTPASLTAATITNPDGSTQPLVPSGTSASDLQGVASQAQTLSKAYQSFTGSGNSSANVHRIEPMGWGFLSDVGDVFNNAVHDIENVGSVVVNAVDDAWHFTVSIAGKAYTAALNTVESVVSAVKWLYNAIKVVIEDIIRFLEFLFEWKDITRTKEVLSNIIKLYLQKEITAAANAQTQVDTMISTLQNTVSTWGQKTDWSNLGNAAPTPVAQSYSSTKYSSTSTNLFAHHFQYNANNISETSPSATLTLPTSPDQVIANLLPQIEAIAADLMTVFSDLATVSLGNLLSNLQTIVVSIVNNSLEVIKDVADAVIEIIVDLASAALSVLDTPIYIPVISNILSAFGVSTISYLDLVCWMMAVPATIVYKMVNDSAPFPDNNTTSQLINASSFDQVANIVTGSTPMVSERMMVNVQQTEARATPTLPSVSQQVFSALHFTSGFCYGVLIMAQLLAAEESNLNDNTSLGTRIFSGVLGLGGAVTNTVANLSVEQCTINNFGVRVAYEITLAERMAIKLLSFTFKDPKEGANLDALFTVPELAFSIYHCTELSADDKVGILAETNNIVSYANRIAYCGVVNIPAPDNAPAAAVLAISNLTMGGLQFGEANTSPNP